MYALVVGMSFRGTQGDDMKRVQQLDLNEKKRDEFTTRLGMAIAVMVLINALVMLSN